MSGTSTSTVPVLVQLLKTQKPATETKIFIFFFINFKIIHTVCTYITELDDQTDIQESY